MGGGTYRGINIVGDGNGARPRGPGMGRAGHHCLYVVEDSRWSNRSSTHEWWVVDCHGAHCLSHCTVQVNTIHDSLFVNNSAAEGGAVYSDTTLYGTFNPSSLYNSYLKLHNTTLQQNQYVCLGFGHDRAGAQRSQGRRKA
jgi:predicted outer membrane repeat protein